jgi:transposase-like protein
MTTKTSSHERQMFSDLHRQGDTYAEIAERFGVSQMCVRYWCRRYRNGQDCQKQKAHKKVGILGRFHPRVRYVILRLRLEHPHWGPNRIREQ